MTYDAARVMNMTLNYTGVAVLLVLLLCFALERKSEKALTRRILFLLSASALEGLMQGTCWLIDRNVRYAQLLRIFSVVDYIAVYLTIWAIMEYLIEFVRASGANHKQKYLSIAHRSVTGVCAVGVVLSLMNLAFPIFFYVDANGCFVYAALAGLDYFLESIGMILCITVILRYKKTFGTVFWLFIALPSGGILSMILEMNSLPLNMGMLIPILLVSAGMYRDLQQRLINQKIALMRSQIQPHFLSNSLLAIHRLCETDPRAAGEAIDAFSLYLRKNIDSLGNSGRIPFADELAHTRAYLDIEKLRYKDMLNIQYDLEVTDFLIPPLTLQPLAENAVRHGLSHLDRTGTLTIRTQRCEKGIAVSVIDDGMGFDPSQLNTGEGKSHIGLSNVRKRLSALSGGTLTLQSAPGMGTTAELLIP